jgi:hypothetical protein
VVKSPLTAFERKTATLLKTLSTFKLPPAKTAAKPVSAAGRVKIVLKAQSALLVAKVLPIRPFASEYIRAGCFL